MRLESNQNFIPYEHGLSPLPINIWGAGNSMWGKGEGFQRRNQQTFSVELIIKGQITYETNHKNFKIDAGEIFLLHSDTHSYYNADENILLKRFLIFKGPSLSSIARDLGLLDVCKIKTSNFPEFVKLFKRVYLLLMQKPSGFSFEISQIAYKILVMLSQELGPAIPNPIKKTIEYMERNLDKPLHNDELAKIAGMSQGHFNRKFRKHYGVSPNKFVIEKRMRLAMFLLENSLHLSIQSISFQCGYEDPLYFSKQYKKWSGDSPKTFRDKIFKIE